MVEPIRVLLVGCGRIARRHVQALEASEDFTLVAAVETDAARAADFSREYGCPVHPTLELALDRERVDLAALATPSGLHAAQIEACAARGVHVLCEKPIALCARSATRALGAAERGGVGVWTVRPLRHWPSLVWVRELLETGELGRPLMLDARVIWSRPQRYYDEAPWRADPGLDGGVLWNQAYHYADLVSWWLGAPEEVASHEATLRLDVGVPDTSSVSLTYPHTVATLHASVIAHELNLDASIALVCERGSILLGGSACERVERAIVGGHELPRDTLDALAERTAHVRSMGHAPLYAQLAADLRAGERPSGGDGSLETVVWLGAARASARLGARVRVADYTSEGGLDV